MARKHPTIQQTLPAFRPVLFLDFDGVTHPDRAPREHYFQAVPVIEAVLRDFPEVDVVLSTSWREKYPLDELRHFFSHEIAERIIDMTPIYSGERSWPDLPFERARRARHGEIQVWLHENRSINHPWIALDDRPWWFDKGAPLLATDMNVGFTPADALKLRERLGSLRRHFTLGAILGVIEMGQALGGLNLDDLAKLERQSRLYSVSGDYPAIQSWPGIAGEPLARCMAALGQPTGEVADRFFTAINGDLAKLTPVEVLIGRVLGVRDLGARSQQLLDEAFDRRLMAVLLAAKICWCEAEA